jgi:hypothetical protein
VIYGNELVSASKIKKGAIVCDSEADLVATDSFGEQSEVDKWVSKHSCAVIASDSAINFLGISPDKEVYQVEIESERWRRRWAQGIDLVE